MTELDHGVPAAFLALSSKGDKSCRDLTPPDSEALIGWLMFAKVRLWRTYCAKLDGVSADMGRLG